MVHRLLLYLHLLPGLAQDCLPNFPNVNGNRSAAAFNNGIHGQLITPQYSFPCDAVITRWEARIIGALDNITKLYFQVWEFDDHRNIFRLLREKSIHEEGITVSQREDKVVMSLDSPSTKIPVQSGNIPGIYIKGNNVRMKFLTNLNIETYVVGTDYPPVFIQVKDEHYHNAAPLLWTQLEVYNQGKHEANVIFFHLIYKA